MKKLSLLLGGAMLAVASSASASFIESSTSCPGDTSCAGIDSFEYGFNFRIEDTTDPNVFKATLTNTTPSTGDALIDQFAFNMDATLNTDFSVDNFNPDTWSISVASGGIQFDYVGDPDSPGDRLDPQATLMFDFIFTGDFLVDNFANPFEVWTETESSSGGGFGGGEDSGQVGVSFQRIGGETVDGSDLLTANWGDVQNGENGGGPGGDPIPEPGILSLIGLGLLGMSYVRRRRHT